MTDQPFLSIKEASKNTGLPEGLIREGIKSGKYDYVRSGKKYFVKVASLIGATIRNEEESNHVSEPKQEIEQEQDTNVPFIYDWRMAYPFSVIEEAKKRDTIENQAQILHRINFTGNGLLLGFREQLTEKERLVIEGRFSARRTLEDIGKSLGITKERARQIESAALRKISDVKFLKSYSVVPYAAYAQEKAKREAAEKRLGEESNS